MKLTAAPSPVPGRVPACDWLTAVVACSTRQPRSRALKFECSRHSTVHSRNRDWLKLVLRVTVHALSACGLTAPSPHAMQRNDRAIPRKLAKSANIQQLMNRGNIGLFRELNFLGGYEIEIKNIIFSSPVHHLAFSSKYSDMNQIKYTLQILMG